MMSAYPTRMRFALTATIAYATLFSSPAHAFADDDARPLNRLLPSAPSFHSVALNDEVTLAALYAIPSRILYDIIFNSAIAKFTGR